MDAPSIVSGSAHAVRAQKSAGHDRVRGFEVAVARDGVAGERVGADADVAASGVHDAEPVAEREDVGRCAVLNVGEVQRCRLTGGGVEVPNGDSEAPGMSGLPIRPARRSRRVGSRQERWLYGAAGGGRWLIAG